MSQNQNFIADGFLFIINPDGKSVTFRRLIDRNAKEVVIPSTVNNYPVTSIGDGAFDGCSGLKNVSIPDSVTEISSHAFNDCTGLTSIEIPNSVTSIGYSAFSGCTGLTSIEIPNSVTSIGYGAFSGCTGLTSVTIGNSVTSIGHYAFSGCTGLTSITIPNSVTTIGYDAFESTAWFDNQPDGLVYAGLVAYTYKGTMPSGTSIVIKDGAKGIASGAFEGCTGLASVTFPDSVTTIGYDAFESTAWFDNQPDGLVYAGLVAYKYKGRMPSGTSIVLKEGTKIISDDAFVDCTGLTSVTIPDSVISIGNSAFNDCSGLTSVTIPNSVTTIGYMAFEGCTGLTSVTIPDSVTEIGYWAFFGCSDLKQVILTGFGHNSKVLPEEIQNQIEILRIGSGISEMGNLRCNPKEIWCYAEVPPKCSERVFTGFDAVLHVPERAAAAYFEADVWRNFTNIVFDADEN